MEISERLLEILVCPETHQRLELAEEELVTKLNARMAEGRLHDRSGHKIDAEIEAGLVREDGEIFYPIRNDVPIMLIDASIVLEP